MENGAPNNLFNEQATEEKGEMARLSSFIGAMAIADLVKTTLGPKGMDKILQSQSRGQEVTVTNDGATILKSIYVDNPAAKVLVDISKVQDDQVGDGTTSVVVLAGELLFCVLPPWTPLTYWSLLATRDARQPTFTSEILSASSGHRPGHVEL